MLINHIDIIIKAQIKITSSKSVKPTKKIRNFYLKKKKKKKEDVKVLIGSQEFSGDLVGK